MSLKRFAPMIAALGMAGLLAAARPASADGDRPFRIDPTLSLEPTQDNPDDALKNMKRASKKTPARKPAKVVPVPQNQETPPRSRPEMQTSSGGAADFFDFDRLELGLNVMMTSWGGDYESDPQAGAQVSLRAPMPWLSELIGVQDDAIGGSLLAGFTSIDIDETPEPPDPDGPVLRFGAALDINLELSSSFYLRPQIGVDWIQFIDVDNTDSGAGFMAGLQLAIQAGEGFLISVNPQASFGEDPIFFITAGVAIGF